MTGGRQSRAGGANDDSRVAAQRGREVSIKRSSFSVSQPIRGVFAAMTLQRGATGKVDLEVFERQIRFCRAAGVEGFVLNGATSEYCLTSPRELGDMLQRARRAVGAAVPLVAAVGGANVLQTSERLVAAQASGADVLLLPMPYFFPYEQEDLVAYAGHVADHASLPVLLYNLPDFTTPLAPETTRKLVEETAIVGIKDSSGGLETLRLLTASVAGSDRVIGNDGALHAAMVEGICDGVVSGVASVLPELLVALYRACVDAPLGGAALELKAALDDVLVWLGKFPVPWGLKVIAGERGLLTPDYPLPLTARRQRDAAELAAWFRANRGRLLAASTLETVSNGAGAKR